MKTSKTLFFLLGALLAALLTWWLAGGKQAAAGTSAVGMPAAGISAAGLPAAGERSALDVIATRTSVRAYRDCPVGADTVELLLRAAMAAPSAMNRQPWVFVVVDDKALLQKFADSLQYAKMAARRRWRSSSARTSPAIRALPATGG
ncbi:MAG: nitroreductase family protein [Alistipes finegoldii]